MGLLETLLFETERRVILFKPTTSMPDGTQLGFDGDPNIAVNGATPGQTLIYNCPAGTHYQGSDGIQWFKRFVPNNWSAIVAEAKPGYTEYSIAASVAARPREGHVVYLTTTKNTVGLAKANSRQTMPAFGVIMEDHDEMVAVKSLNTIYTNVHVDSEATIEAGDELFISFLEAGKITEIAPEIQGYIAQYIGTSDENQSEGKVDIQFQPGPIIEL